MFMRKFSTFLVFLKFFKKHEMLARGSLQFQNLTEVKGGLCKTSIVDDFLISSMQFFYRGQIVHQTLKPPLKNYARSSLQWSIPIVFNKSLVPISVNSSSPKYGISREPPPPLKFKKSL